MPWVSAGKLFLASSVVALGEPSDLRPPASEARSEYLGLRKKAESGTVVVVMLSTQGYDRMGLEARQRRSVVSRASSPRDGVHLEDARA